jgi:myo-inositol-1(or 4)-monophosphatase
MQSSRGIRRLGSAALDMAYVASGKFDGFFEYSLHPWDVAAGIILIKEAGGKVSDFRFGNDYLFGKEMLASNGLIHTELMKEISKHFK